MEVQNNGQSFVQSLEKNIRSLLSMGAIIYAWGFVVASIYLSQYHVVSLNLLRIQYILAGIWIVLPVIIFVIILFWLSASVDFEFINTPQKHTEQGNKRFRRILIGLLTVLFALISYCVLSSIFLKWSAPNVIAQFTSLSFLDVLGSIGFCLAITITFSAAWSSSQKIRDKSGKLNVQWFITLVIGISVTGLVLVGYTFFFATKIYPKIPSVFGGGKPIEVRLILAHDSNYESSREILHFTDNQELSPLLELITTTENDYVIIDPVDSHRVILLPKESVSLFILESR